MPSRSRVLRLLPDTYAICHLSPDQEVPSWAFGAVSEFVSVTRSKTELSVICAADALADEMTSSTDWRCLSIEGSCGLHESGVLVSVANPLASAGISVFAVATYDTDYLLVTDIDGAIAALRRAGHQIIGNFNDA